jgi:hypothetical protein
MPAVRLTKNMKLAFERLENFHRVWSPGCQTFHSPSEAVGMEHRLITGGGSDVQVYALGAYRATVEILK